MTTKTCTREGCGKTLRANNQTGMCATGCRSPDAPASQRTVAPPAGEEDVLVRFRRVAKALGKDPDAILDDANRKVAAAWLKTLEDAIS